MPLAILSPQETTYALLPTDSIAICGQTDDLLSHLWTLTGSGHHTGPAPGDPISLGASDLGLVPIGDWNAGSVGASPGQHHVLFWTMLDGTALITFHGARTFDVVAPDSCSASGALTTVDCP